MKKAESVSHLDRFCSRMNSPQMISPITTPSYYAVPPYRQPLSIIPTTFIFYYAYAANAIALALNHCDLLVGPSAYKYVIAEKEFHQSLEEFLPWNFAIG